MVAVYLAASAMDAVMAVAMAAAIAVNQNAVANLH